MISVSSLSGNFGSKRKSLRTDSGRIALGGTYILDRNISGTNYAIHVFNSTGTLVFNKLPRLGTVDLFLIAGGGGC
jgi:hypothetical protein